MTAAELAAWSRDMVRAHRGAVAVALREIGNFQADKLRAAAVSRERLHPAVESLDNHRAQMVARLEPVMQTHATLAGEPDPPAAARKAAEQLVVDHLEESRRQLRPLLDAWPGQPAGEAALERILEKWPLRAERIADRLAQQLLREGSDA